MNVPVHPRQSSFTCPFTHTVPGQTSIRWPPCLLAAPEAKCTCVQVHLMNLPTVRCGPLLPSCLSLSCLDGTILMEGARAPLPVLSCPATNLTILFNILGNRLCNSKHLEREKERESECTQRKKIVKHFLFAFYLGICAGIQRTLW